jgi:hypothetical protein
MFKLKGLELGIGLGLLALFVWPSQAQSDLFEGLVLLNVVEIGATQAPNHLYLADVASGQLTELLVENQSIFAPWAGWSPDGRKFAYLAPSRQGQHYELWLADASINAPVPRPPLFNLDLSALQADWHPRLNFVAVSTPNGLYVVNANFENVVLLTEERLPSNGILDWSHDGQWLAYSTEDGGLNIINGDSRQVLPLRPFTLPRPALLPMAGTGWTADDRYYIFSDDIYQALYAIRTDGSGAQAVFSPEFSADPFNIHLMPTAAQLTSLNGTTFYLSDLDADEQQISEITLGHRLEPDYAITQSGQILLNSFIPLPEGDFAECLLFNPRTGAVELLRQALQNMAWTHTRCQLLADGRYMALIATDQLLGYEALPADQHYELYIVTADLGQTFPISPTYPGFDSAPLGFDPQRNQVILLEEDRLILYNLQGQSKMLINLRDLNLQGQAVRIEFLWQP